MAASLFNPFKKIFETKQTPHARTLRTSLWQKFKDAYDSIHGEFFIKDKGIERDKSHFGLYDYATLFVPWLLEMVIPFSSLVFTPLRIVVSLLATVIASPVILAVQAVSSAIEVFKGRKAVLSAIEFSRVVDGDDIEDDIEEVLNLGEYIKKHGTEGFDIVVERVLVSQSSTSEGDAEISQNNGQMKTYELKFFDRQTENIYSLCNSGIPDKVRSALTALNMGKFVGYIENDDRLDREEKAAILGMR